MTFKEYYMEKYQLDRWGSTGEEFTDVFNRLADTIGEYIDDQVRSLKRRNKKQI